MIVGRIKTLVHFDDFTKMSYRMFNYSLHIIMLKILKRNLNILTNVKNSISESLNKTQQIPTFQLISLDGEEYYG